MKLKGKCKISSLCNFRGRFSRQEDTQDMWSPSSASLRVELRAGTLEGASVFFFAFLRQHFYLFLFIELAFYSQSKASSLLIFWKL